MDEHIWLTLLTIAAYSGMAALLIVLLIRYFLSPFGSAHDGALRLIRRETRPKERFRQPKDALLFILAMFLLSRALFFLLGGWAVCAREGCGLGEYLRTAPYQWMKWDARHYIALTEDWYVNTGDERLKLVFYPLYPAVARVFNMLLMNAAASAFLVSNLSLIGAGWMLYRVCAREYDTSFGRRAVFFLMFCPMGFYFSVPYTESLFLLTTLAAVDAAQRRRWLPALVWGALSALTRSLGLLTAVCVFYEMLRAIAPDEKARPARQLTRPDYLRRAGLSALACCLIAIGFGLYLLLNYRVSGDPFRFLEYQESNWSQQFGSLRYTLSYTFENAVSYHNEAYRTGVWIPQLVYFFGSLAVMLACANRIRPSYGAYGLLYAYMAYAPTWLLSGPRYLTAMFALYPMLALLSRRRWAFALLAAASLAGCVIMTWQFHFGMCVL